MENGHSSDGDDFYRYFTGAHRHVPPLIFKNLFFFSVDFVSEQSLTTTLCVYLT